MAWWIHDHLPYNELQFFPKLGAFNIGWHERPLRTIFSFITPRGYLTRPGFANHAGTHSAHYDRFPVFTDARLISAETVEFPPAVTRLLA